jgi:hypothetical protein
MTAKCDKCSVESHFKALGDLVLAQHRETRAAVDEIQKTLAAVVKRQDDLSWNQNALRDRLDGLGNLVILRKDVSENGSEPSARQPARQPKKLASKP